MNKEARLWLECKLIEIDGAMAPLMKQKEEALDEAAKAGFDIGLSALKRMRREVEKRLAPKVSL